MRTVAGYSLRSDDKPAILAQDSVRSGYAGDVGENLAAQAMTDLAERASLGVRELQPTIQLRLHDAVFGGQIFVPRQQLLVHRPRYVGQHPRPIHNGPPCPDPRRRASLIISPIVPDRLRTPICQP